jgi:hypothetical protein
MKMHTALARICWGLKNNAIEIFFKATALQHLLIIFYMCFMRLSDRQGGRGRTDVIFLVMESTGGK